MTILNHEGAIALVAKHQGAIPDGDALRSIISFSNFAKTIGITCTVSSEASDAATQGKDAVTDPQANLMRQYVRGVLTISAYIKNTVAAWGEGNVTAQVQEIAPGKSAAFVYDALRDITCGAYYLGKQLIPDLRPADAWHATAASFFSHAGLRIQEDGDVLKVQPIECDHMIDLRVLPGFGRLGIPHNPSHRGLFEGNLAFLTHHMPKVYNTPRVFALI